MESQIYPLYSLTGYRYAVVLSRYQGGILLSRHRERTTWETQGGHIEAGETPLDCARRELYEESGALEYALTPLFDYRAGGECGVVFAAQIEKLGDLPESEMEEVRVFGALPDNLTYPDITPVLFRQAEAGREQDRAARAKNYFYEGYNCAQSVLLAFSQECGLSRETALLLSSSFGGGMGRLREVCGAVSAMFMAAGLCLGYQDPRDGGAKARHYERIQRMAARFRQENGSYICRELLSLPQGPDAPRPAERTPEYYRRRPCADLIYSAARILESELHHAGDETVRTE